MTSSVSGIGTTFAGVRWRSFALVARGAEVGEIRDMGGVRFAYFSDPDGNTWELQDLTGMESL